MSRRHRSNQIGGQFAPRLVEMLDSPAYRVLSLSGHRVISRIEIEFARHAGESALRGNENGKLPVTYGDFISYGIHHDAIAPAIREVVALGFVEITEHGRAGNAEYRSPNKYRLSYRHTKQAEPTHDWRRIKSIEEAESIAAAARTEKSKKRKPTPGKRTVSHPKTGAETKQTPPPKNGCTDIPPKTGALSISRYGAAAQADGREQSRAKNRARPAKNAPSRAPQELPRQQHCRKGSNA